ncbi:MAG: hypothetical protein QOH64_1760 [Acidimicrobiaceae bacterium]
MRSQSVPVNVYETTGALVVLSPLPAVTAQDVTIELREGTLRFWAHLRSAPPREYVTHEWEYGGYEREVDVPEGYGGGVEGVARQRPARHPRPEGRDRRVLEHQTVVVRVSLGCVRSSLR